MNFPKRACSKLKRQRQLQIAEVSVTVSGASGSSIGQVSAGKEVAVTGEDLEPFNRRITHRQIELTSGKGTGLARRCINGTHLDDAIGPIPRVTCAVEPEGMSVHLDKHFFNRRESEIGR